MVDSSQAMGDLQGQLAPFIETCSSTIFPEKLGKGGKVFIVHITCYSLWVPYYLDPSLAQNMNFRCNDTIRPLGNTGKTYHKYKAITKHSRY